MKKIIIFFLICTYIPGKNATGQTNLALNFDGVNDYVEIPNYPMLNFGTGNFCVEFWIRSPADNHIETIFEKRDDNCNDGNFWMIRKSGYGNIGFGINTPGLSADDIGILNANDNTWHHIAFVRTGTLLTAYKDGVLAASKITATIEDVSNTDNLGIGSGPCRSYLPDDGFFRGGLDDVRLWNISRSEAEIQANYQCEIMPQAGLVANYRFNQGIPNGNNTSITSVYDGSGNGFDGKLSGFARIGTISNFVSDVPDLCPQMPNSSAALNFDGSNDYVEIPNYPMLNFETGIFSLIHSS